VKLLSGGGAPPFPGEVVARLHPHPVFRVGPAERLERIASLYSGLGMSTSVTSSVSASYRDGKVRVILASGLELAFPVAGNPSLEGGTEAELERIELFPFGETRGGHTGAGWPGSATTPA